jgi:hypothetical protein
MDIVASRIFVYSILPLIIAIGQVGLDKSSRSRERKIETFLLYLFGIGVAGSGIGGFFGHVFISDSVAKSIGWPTGNPFQLEVGFANLAIGILGIIAMGRRDGFREATVIAVTVFGVGATIVHVSDYHPDRQSGTRQYYSERRQSSQTGIAYRFSCSQQAGGTLP